MFDPERPRLLGQLLTEGSIASDDYSSSPALRKKGSKDSDGLPGASRQNCDDGVVLASEHLTEQKSLVIAGEGGSWTFCVKRQDLKQSLVL